MRPLKPGSVETSHNRMKNKLLPFRPQQLSSQLLSPQQDGIPTLGVYSIDPSHPEATVNLAAQIQAALNESIPPLPEISRIQVVNFKWGNCDGSSVTQAITSAYAEAVHWRRNSFMVPSGKAGKDFVRELTRLFSAYAEGTALEPVALKAAMVMSLLLLQNPHSTSKSKEHTHCLERRLRSWSLGDIEALMNEGRTIQLHLPLSRPLNHTQEQRQARTFAHLMFQGKVRAALRLVSDQCSSGVLIDQEIDGTLLS